MFAYSRCFKGTSTIKRELIQAVAAKAELTNAQVKAAPDVFGAVTTEALVADKKIRLPGVFTTSAIQCAGRKGRNPVTNEVMTIPARRITKFAPASVLKGTL